MNKHLVQGKNKIKTLPNQVQSKHQQYTFKSQYQSDYIKKINITSPTFATNDLGSNYQVNGQKNDQINKQNKISLSLKQANYRDNTHSRDQMQFVKQQYKKMIEKCKQLQQINGHLEEQNKILTEKLEVSIKKIQGKYCKKLLELLQSNNNIEVSNKQKIDFYLQMKIFKQSYNNFRDQNQKYKEENQELKNKIKQLENIIISYTQKEERKNKEKHENSQKITKIEKLYIEKLEQFKIQIQKQKKQKESIKYDYQNLKFLKQQIQKKRQQQLTNIKQLQKQITTKQTNIKQQKDEYCKLQHQYKIINNKLKISEDKSNNFQQQLHQSQKQYQKIQLNLSTLQTQIQKYKNIAENYKLTNQKYTQEITLLRKKNQQYYDLSQNLKIQKDKLDNTIQKHLKKILQLQNKIISNDRQMQQLKLQFDQWLSKNTIRSYPQVTKFKVEQQQSQKGTVRLPETTQIFIQQKMRLVQQKYHSVVQGLNKQIQELKKNKQNLQIELDSQRGRNQRANVELQNTYRKVDEFICSECEKQIDQNFSNARQKDKYGKNGNIYGTAASVLTLQLTKVTKAAPQLKMIKDILTTILSTNENNIKGTGSTFVNSRQKQKDTLWSLQNLIDDIKKMAEQTADYFDECSRQIQSLLNKIVNKEEVISKLLKFTPELKKGCILQYLKVMENIDEYSADHVYKVTRVLEEEANEWKRGVNNLLEIVQKNESQISQLRKQMIKYKSDGGIKKYQQQQPSDKIEKMERYERDVPQRNQRYHQYHQRRRV